MSSKHACGFLLISCSQNRNTVQPAFLRVRVTIISRLLFPSIFFSQKARCDAGIVRHFLHPCQKHPSIKIITLSFGKTKSGFPIISRGCSFQPEMPNEISRARNRHSVDRFPRPRTADMTSERLAFVKTSAIEVMSRVQTSFLVLRKCGVGRHAQAYEWFEGRPRCWASAG